MLLTSLVLQVNHQQLVQQHKHQHPAGAATHSTLPSPCPHPDLTLTLNQRFLYLRWVEFILLSISFDQRTRRYDSLVAAWYPLLWRINGPRRRWPVITTVATAT